MTQFKKVLLYANTYIAVAKETVLALYYGTVKLDNAESLY